MRLDPPLVFFGMASAVPLLFERIDRTGWSIACLAAALATLVKGPFGLLPLPCAALAAAVVYRQPSRMAWAIACTILATLPALSFLLWDRGWGGGSWWSGYLQQQILASATGRRSDGVLFWWYPLQIVARRFWTGLPFALLGGGGERCPCATPASERTRMDQVHGALRGAGAGRALSAAPKMGGITSNAGLSAARAPGWPRGRSCDRAMVEPRAAARKNRWAIHRRPGRVRDGRERAGLWKKASFALASRVKTLPHPTGFGSCGLSDVLVVSAPQAEGGLADLAQSLAAERRRLFAVAGAGLWVTTTVRATRGLPSYEEGLPIPGPPGNRIAYGARLDLRRPALAPLQALPADGALAAAAGRRSLDRESASAASSIRDAGALLIGAAVPGATLVVRETKPGVRGSRAGLQMPSNCFACRPHRRSSSDRGRIRWWQ